MTNFCALETTSAPLPQGRDHRHRLAAQGPAGRCAESSHFAPFAGLDRFSRGAQAVSKKGEFAVDDDGESAPLCIAQLHKTAALKNQNPRLMIGVIGGRTESGYSQAVRHPTPFPEKFDEKALDDLAALAGQLCQAPIGRVTLLEGDGPEFTPFCQAVLARRELLVVSDARHDARFQNNAGGVTFYAGLPLVESGEVVGTLSVMDYVPRPWTPSQEWGLKVLGQQVVAQLQIRRQVQQQERAEARQKQVRKREVASALRRERDRAQRYLDNAEVILLALDLEGKITLVNRKGCDLLGWTESELLGRNWIETCLPERIRPRIQKKFEELRSSHLSRSETHPDQRWPRSHDRVAQPRIARSPRSDHWHLQLRHRHHRTQPGP